MSRRTATMFALATALSVAVSGSAHAQQTVPIGEPSSRATEGFTNIFEVVEMRDGRVLMTDSRERTVAIVDFGAGTVERIGRKGEGPEEYLTAYTILPQPDGSFHIYDSRNRRFLVVSAEGVVTGTVRLTRPALSGFSSPRGPDDSGALYINNREVDNNGLRPEAPLYRWMHDTGDLELVANISNFEPGQQGRGFVPMPREDAWSFLVDGSVALIVAEDYHVEWSGGELGDVSGPPIPHPRVRVGEREREAWLDAIYSRPRASVSSSGRGGGSSRTAARRPVDPDRFPKFVPPFKRGYAPAAPWGEIWLELETASDGENTVFDVLGRDGQLQRRVNVPGRARVVGFGEDAVYIVRKDAFDLEWLEKYAR